MISSFLTPRASARAAALALLTSGLNAQAISWTENFNTVVPTGWTVVNNSAPVGSESWFQGNTAIFDAQSGPADSYAAANLNSAGGNLPTTISNWLITPSFAYAAGDTLSFWTRIEAPSTFADRLEVRFSASGGTNVGTTNASVGDFTSLLLTVNPTLSATGYPDVWTQYSVTLPSATSGAFAFRYFVTDAGPVGTNSSYIGIDTLAVTAVPEPMGYLLAALGLGVVLLRRKPVVKA
jgi:hypothetical protein